MEEAEESITITSPSPSLSVPSAHKPSTIPPVSLIKAQQNDAADESLLITSPTSTCSKTPRRSPLSTIMRGSTTPLLNTSTISENMPIITPKTMSTSLLNISQTTFTQLEQIWDLVGYTSDERNGQISDLVAQIKKLCEQKVMEERGVAEQFRSSIAECKKEFMELSKSMRRNVDFGLLNNENSMCLTDELSSIESILENLREESKHAQEELLENQNTLLGIYTALYSSPESLPIEWNDISSDLTKERREEFQRHVEEMQGLMEKKVKVVNTLIKDCVTLFKELRLYHEKDDVEERERASTSNSLNEEFQLTSFDRKVIQTYQTIILCSNDTDHPSTVDPSMYKESSTCIGISDATVSTLKTRMKSLLEEKRHRKLTLHKMGTQIGHLWEKLKIPESVQRDFTESVKGLGMDTIQKGKNELDRLNLLKQEMIGKLISESRQEINALFDELNTGHEARLKFTPGLIADESLFTDELLEQHEEFVSSLKQKLEQMRPILNLIGRREEVLKERMEYEQLQKDPERLQQRGAALTKQLMKEEKMSRRIKKDLPKYTQVLRKKCIEWEQTHSSQFMYKDKSYLELMEEQEEQWKEYKEKETQLKLEKRMKERNAAKENFQTGGSSFYKPLPGKKKAPSDRKIGTNTSRSKSRTNMSGRTGMTSRPKSRPRPLSDAQSRDNSSSYRNPSRSRLIAPARKTQ